MPLAKDTKLWAPDTSYFTTLKQLDDWAAHPTKKLDAILEYTPRPQPVISSDKGKLLVCHDYKGGYTESPFSPSYTFNFWSSCDIFIYFSHHRVTIPPPGWITAAHRQGVKILGTLIFESGAEPDCLRLLVGNLPSATTAPARHPANSTSLSLPLSPHYARLLAALALQRGFDGYLLNFECPLQGGVEQTRVLAAWIALLRSELVRTVGDHAECIWYDSTIFTGALAWQDRLNSLNLPFFLASTGFFTNYTWPADYPSLSTQYLLSLPPNLTPQQLPNNSNILSSIYTGIDVWGRGSHGGGGFGSYKALEHITSTSPPGQSTALFGPAWTWETQQDNPGFTWDTWWAYERKLWVGLGSTKAKSQVEVPMVPPPRRKRQNEEEEPECPHGPFRPLVEFFERMTPPDPCALPLWTCFSPGVGKGWWVGGVRVMEDGDGWTDLDKQCSVGDLVWPVPELQLEGKGEWEAGSESNIGDLPKTKSEICMSDAWNGGSSLRLRLFSPSAGPTTDIVSEDAVYRNFWLPVQSLGLTIGKTYEATLVYKLESCNADIDLDIGFSVKPLLATDPATFEITPLSLPDSETLLPGGWTKLGITFIIPQNDSQAIPTIKSGIGLSFTVLAETLAQWHAFDVSLLLGQLSVYPARPDHVEPYEPMILWADLTPQLPSPSSSLVPVGGTITWETGITFPDTPNSTITSTEDPVSVFKVPPSTQEYPWFPSFVYFNIYALVHHPVNGTVGQPENSVWIGTSGGTAEGRKCAFGVVWKSLKVLLGLGDGGVGKGKVTFYVQGVTDRGVVLGWERCVYVDVNVDWDV